MIFIELKKYVISLVEIVPEKGMILIMENASKALIIAGGVLIVILVLTLFAYINTKMGSGTHNLYSRLEDHDITEFNQKFLNYDGNKNLKIQDVVTLINTANNANINNNIGAHVDVLVDNASYLDKTIDDLNTLLKDKADETYTCNVRVTGKIVSQVTITENPQQNP